MNAPDPLVVSEGTPAPCTTCGAPMVIIEPVALHQNPELSCRYCGQREGMPVEAAERHRHLRLRLLQLSRARDATEAPLQTFKAMNEMWPFAIAGSLAMGAFQSWNFFSNWRTTGQAQLAMAVYGAFPLAIAFGMLSGWLGMRHAFAAQLKPLLRARPPLSVGQPARCRTCGGALAPVRAPSVTCSYCQTSNLLDTVLTAEASALLAREAQEYERRMRPWARDPDLYLAPSRAFYRYAAIGGGVALVALTAVLGLLAGLG